MCQTDLHFGNASKHKSPIKSIASKFLWKEMYIEDKISHLQSVTVVLECGEIHGKALLISMSVSSYIQ
jgi:hypothetical protein